MKIVKFLGGLGNQMFQYAFYLSLSNKQSNVKADVSDFETYELHNGLELEKVFNIKLNKASLFSIKIFNPFYRTWIFRKLRRILNLKKAYFTEKTPFFFDSEALNSSKSKMYWGYWQHLGYFEQISEQIKQDFSFKSPLKNENLAISNLITTTESVSIHVRRGDYVGHSLLGGICDSNFYENAIQIIKHQVSAPTFFVFSNDINWCKENIKVKNVHYISWNQNENSYIDMQLMSMCKHNIIANSSFSWWGAWLNPNKHKIVVSPKRWTNDSKDTLALDEWIKC